MTSHDAWLAFKKRLTKRQLSTMHERDIFEAGFKAAESGVTDEQRRVGGMVLAIDNAERWAILNGLKVASGWWLMNDKTMPSNQARNLYKKLHRFWFMPDGEEVPF